MKYTKPTLLVLIGAILIAWLLVASIHPIQPVVNAGSNNQNNNNNFNQGPSTGAGNNLGGGGGSGGWNLFRLPSFNFSFPNLLNIHWPNFNLKLPSWNIRWPSFRWPTIHWPNWGLGLGGGSGSGSGPGSRSGTCQSEGICQSGSSGGGGGSGGTSGNSGSNVNTVRSQTTKQQQQQVFFTIPKDWLIAIVVVVLIIAGTILVMRSKNAVLEKLKRGNPKQTQLDTPVPVIPPVLEGQPGSQSISIPFEAEEKVEDYKGWGSQGGFLKPLIDQGLPLIWGFDDPLALEAPKGTSVFLGKDNAPIGMQDAPPKENAPQQQHLQTGFVSFRKPTNVLHGSYLQNADAKWIRAVHYNEDVMKLFRLNFLLNGGESSDKILFGELTPRELITKITSEKPELVKDKQALNSLTRIFERAFYGKKKISRAEYEMFLKSLSMSLANPKVIICGPKAAAAQ